MPAASLEELQKAYDELLEDYRELLLKLSRCERERNEALRRSEEADLRREAAIAEKETLDRLYTELEEEHRVFMRGYRDALKVSQEREDEIARLESELEAATSADKTGEDTSQPMSP